MHQRALRKTIKRLQPTCIHVVVQPDCDFAAISAIANECGAPIAASFHDHPKFFLDQEKSTTDDVAMAKDLWLNAACRFVISPEMGDRLCQDFGRRDYEIVTDGVDRFGTVNGIEAKRKYSIYFMGLLHDFYEPNFQSLVQALDQVGRESGVHFVLRIRSSCHPQFGEHTNVRVEYYPFADEATVAEDMERADIMYLPLPFGDNGGAFADLSLSTKMVSYLATGRPILYHGPPASAAGRLLARSNAAFCATTLGSLSLVSMIQTILSDPSHTQQVAASALQLAKTQFDLSRIRARFWGRMLEGNSSAGATLDAKKSQAAADSAAQRQLVGHTVK
jgi:hypothetical protein